ncbi:MAG: peroxiredoxin-like family protein [Melioribacteraceae bacterium]|nr:AhpC/TSA family protein [Melioribacteraceae bacterium]MDD3559735.1 peroxiredoxin-like family protein [Melioribacteraceae bacterium]
MKFISTYIIVFTLLSITIFSMHQSKDIVASSAEEVCPINIGDKVPSVNLRDIDGEEINLRDITRDKKSILIFYRGGWCPYCNLHLSELQNIENEIVELGYKLIAVSIDKPGKLKESLQEHKLNYELYSDSKAEASRAFGIAFKVGDSQVEMLKSHNMDLEKSSGEQHHILPVPSVFIVDEEGKIKFEYVNPNYKERISGRLLLSAAKEIK